MRFIGNDPNILDAFYTATADGSIAAGKPVIVTAPSESKGSEAEFDAVARYIAAVYDTSNDKVVLSYQDGGNSSYGTSVVGTVSGSSITFGTPVVFESAAVENCRATFDSDNNKVLIIYKDGGNSNYGTAIVGTVSGTSISFGSAVVFYSGALDGNCDAAFDSSNNKSVITYRDSSQYGNAIVATISGTTPSFGSPVVFESAQSNYNKPHFDSSNNKMLITYVDGGNSDAGTAIVGTVSGTSISFGSAVVFESGQTMLPDAAFDSTANKFVVSFVDFADSSDGKARVATISGTSVSFGTVATFYTGAANTSEDSLTTAYDASFNKTLIAFRDSTGANNYSHYVYATIASGATTLTFSSSAPFDDNDYTSLSMDAVYDPDAEKVVLAWRAGSTKGMARTLFQDPGGDVAQVAQTGGSSATVGTAVNFTSELPAGSSSEEESSIVFDPSNNKVVIFFRDEDNSNYGTGIVGTIDSSDNSISFGSKVVWESAYANEILAVYDSGNQKIVLHDYRRARVVTVSGDSFSVGSATAYTSNIAQKTSMTYDPDVGRVVVAFQNYSSSSHGQAVVGTVSGTSISWGSLVSFHSASTGATTCAYDTTNDKVVIAFQDTAESNNIKAVVGTVSGTSISFGSESSAISGVGSSYPSIAFDSTNGKMVVVYVDGSQSDKGYASVGTVSSTSISFGTQVQFDSSEVAFTKVAFAPNKDKMLVCYRDAGSSHYGKIIQGTVSGTSISFANESTFASTDSDNIQIAYDTNVNRLAIQYRDDTDSDKGMAIVYAIDTLSTNLTSENYIGITDQAYTDGQDATVAVVGCIDRNQTSLTPGQQYFIQNDGTLSTTAGSPSVLAGTAISATELVVKE